MRIRLLGCGNFVGSTGMTMGLDCLMLPGWNGLNF